MERTLVLVKPDGVQRGLIGQVIKRFEDSGMKVVALKMIKPTKELASKNYPDSEEWYRRVGERSIDTFTKMGMDIKKKFGTTEPIVIGKTIKSWLVNFLSSSEVVAMVMEGNRAADNGRRLVGETDPLKAMPGSIRGDFSIDNIINGNTLSRPAVNVVHASGSADEAAQEIPVWFTKSEIFEYKRDNEGVFYKQW